MSVAEQLELALVEEWHTGPLERVGPERFVHLIRAPDDPERESRESRKARGTTPEDSTREWRSLAKVPIPELAAAIRAHLSDGIPRTANRIMVELFGKTADVVFEDAPDRALWSLVDAGEVEHTMVAPVLFRRRA